MNSIDVPEPFPLNAVDRRLTIAVFVAAFAVCALLTKAHVTSWNDGSRIATVDALTANKTFVIDGSPYAVNLGDKILFHGRHYSDKPPLLSLSATGIALLVAPLGITLRHTPGTAIYLITLLTVGVWFALGCCYAYAFQRLLGFGPRVGVAVAALSGLATLALPYATVLTNHVPCGASALAGCYHLVRGREGGRVHDVLAGMFFALAYAFDASGIVFAVAGAVLLWRAAARRWLLCIAAGAPIVALQLTYNVFVSGSILPTAFTANVWSEFPLKPGASAPQPFELLSAADYARLAVNLLFGGKGLLSYTPLVLVAGYGAVVMLRAGGPMWRVACAIVVTTAVYFVLILTLQNDFAAQNYGERRYVDVFFLIGVALGPALASVRGRLAVVATRLCIALSVGIAALGTVAPFGGAQGQSGFSFGTAEFAALMRRAPVQAGIDVLVLIVLIAFVLWLLPFPRRYEAAPRR
ncbi:MAG: hypothetical protein M3154_04055 [Candidatus Eremiobacteraeota bacterium]|nr:hypothetical protein [Candidatus Eremiobacteraeota bacterium]